MSYEEKVALAKLYLYLYCEQSKYASMDITRFHKGFKKSSAIPMKYGAKTEYTKKLKKVSKFYAKFCGHKLTYSVAKEILNQKEFIDGSR
jgi:hypothetical protein